MSEFLSSLDSSTIMWAIFVTVVVGALLTRTRVFRTGFAPGYWLTLAIPNSGKQAIRTYIGLPCLGLALFFGRSKLGIGLEISLAIIALLAGIALSRRSRIKGYLSRNSAESKRLIEERERPLIDVDADSKIETDFVMAQAHYIEEPRELTLNNRLLIGKTSEPVSIKLEDSTTIDDKQVYIGSKASTPTILFGATGSGKTTCFCIGNVLMWNGPQIVASVKDDIATPTFTYREKYGETSVFAPNKESLPDHLRPYHRNYTPLQGCTDWPEAFSTSEALVKASGKEDKAGEFFISATKPIMAAFMYYVANVLDDPSIDRSMNTVIELIASLGEKPAAEKKADKEKAVDKRKAMKLPVPENPALARAQAAMAAKSAEGAEADIATAEAQAEAVSSLRHKKRLAQDARRKAQKDLASVESEQSSVTRRLNTVNIKRNDVGRRVDDLEKVRHRTPAETKRFTALKKEYSQLVREKGEKERRLKVLEAEVPAAAEALKDASNELSRLEELWAVAGKIVDPASDQRLFARAVADLEQYLENLEPDTKLYNETRACLHEITSASLITEVTLSGLIASANDILQVYKIFVAPVWRVTLDDPDLLDVSTFLDGRNTTYIITPNSDGEKLRPVTTALVAHLIRLAQQTAELAPNARLPLPANFMIDELANIAPIPNLDRLCSTARSTGIQLTLILQNQAQLDGVYGQHERKTIISNCPTRIHIGSVADPSEAEEISKLAGIKTIHQKGTSTTKTKGHSTSPKSSGPGTANSKSDSEASAETYSPARVPVIEMGVLASLGPKELFCFLDGDTAHLLTTPYYEDEELLSRVPPQFRTQPMPSRGAQRVKPLAKRRQIEQPKRQLPPGEGYVAGAP